VQPGHKAAQVQLAPQELPEQLVPLGHLVQLVQVPLEQLVLLEQLGSLVLPVSDQLAPQVLLAVQGVLQVLLG
jgi:hypothetical protein